MRVLIVGCGYVGIPLGIRLVDAGHEVDAVRRTGAEELKAAGLGPILCDISELGTFPPLEKPYEWVINCAAAGGGPDEYRKVYLEGNRNLVAWLRKSPPKAYVYTSSTSVYAQNDGSPVTEDDPANPDAETGRILREAEQLLLAAAATGEMPAMVLRCAGIYGPGRGYWLQQFLRGEAVMEEDGSRWLNMIHRDDVGVAVTAALEKGKAGSVYNVVDDEPVQQRTMFEWLARRLGKPLPPSVPESNVARRRGATNKRILNGKLRRELGCLLTFPTFREGYEAELRRLGEIADE